MPLRMSWPQVLPAGPEYEAFNGREIQTATRLNMAPTYTRVLSCTNCRVPFCTGHQVISNIYTLQNIFYPDFYVVQLVANTRLVQENDRLFPFPLMFWSQLGNETSVCLHAARCTNCSVVNGFKVLALQNPDRDDNGLHVEQYLLFAHAYEQIP